MGRRDYSVLCGKSTKIFCRRQSAGVRQFPIAANPCPLPTCLRPVPGEKLRERA
jgi:hypothetical protein